jgi:site-specific recombinase XerD
MAGKKNISGKKENRGGRRPGAGRKPKYMLSETQIKNMLRAARKKAKETGKTIDDILLDIIYTDGKKISERDQLAAIKLFKDFTITKSSEKTVTHNVNQGPAVGLPPIREDEGLKVISGGKKE